MKVYQRNPFAFLESREEGIAPLGNFSTEALFLHLQNLNVKCEANVHGEIHLLYNRFLDEKWADFKIPGGENLEVLEKDTSTLILRPDLYFKAYRDVLKRHKESLSLPNLPLTTGSFFESIEIYNRDKFDALRGKIHLRYNQLVRKVDASAPFIPNEGDVGATPIAYLELYLQAFEDVISPKQPNKYENLLWLHHATDSLPGVEVPFPQVISHELINKFLEEHTPAVFTLWKRIAEEYTKTKELPLEIIDELQEGIRAAFASKVFSFSPELIEWFDNIREKDEFLMVRSSSAEDGIVSNAGGNTSVSYVLPSPSDVLSAIGEVVASYFSFTSLKSRLNAGEDIFSTDARFTVLLQPLIGERIDGETDAKDIPVSCVLFSNEPHYVGTLEHAPFRIMRLSASFGHGEGVVGFQGIGVDSLLALQSRVNPDEIYVVYDVAEKPTRLAPVREDDGKVILRTVDNPSDLHNKEALDPLMIKRLFDLATIIEEKKSGSPVDMELVIKGDTIYPVQVRPINRKRSLPTYIDSSAVDLDRLNILGKADKVLVPATSSVVEVISPNQVLFASSLVEAEHLFEADKHLMVVVSQDEPSLSHPIVNFSEMGIPCFMIKDVANIPHILESSLEEKKRVFICIQSGTIYSSQGIDLLIKEGYIKHPAPIRFSFFPTLSQPPYLPEEVRAMLCEINAEKIRELSHHSLMHKPAETSEALQKMIERLSGRVTTLDAMSEETKRLAQKVDRTYLELVSSIEIEAPHSEILFYAKALEELLQNSVQKLPLVEEHAKLISEHQKRVGAPLIYEQESVAALSTINKEVHDKFLNFLHYLEKTGDRRFVSTFALLRKEKLLPFWINTVFIFATKDVSFEEDAEETLLQLLSESKVSISLDIMSAFQAFERSMQHFSSPSTFDMAHEALIHLLSQFKDIAPATVFHEGSTLEKMLCLTMMERIIMLFDTAIKTTKMGSFDPITKTKYFKEMVVEYHTLMKQWYLDTPFRPISSWVNHYDKEISASLLITKIGKTLFLTKESDPSNLKGSPYFTPQQNIIGLIDDIFFIEPQTIEDHFTMIHQNLLSLLGLLYLDIFGENKVQLPSCLKKSRDIMENLYPIIFKRVSPIKPIKIDITDSIFSITYSIPLRDHCALITLESCFDDTKIEVKYRLLGGDEWDRWTLIGNHIELCESSGIYSIVSPPLNRVIELTGSIQASEDHLRSAIEILFRFMFVLNGAGYAYSLSADNNYLLYQELALSKIALEEPTPTAEDLIATLRQFLEQWESTSNSMKAYHECLISLHLLEFALEFYGSTDSIAKSIKGMDLYLLKDDLKKYNQERLGRIIEIATEMLEAGI